MSYWEECIAEAFEDSKISATEGQIKNVASWVSGAHENYGMAHGHDCISNPLRDENKDLETKLKIERSKVVCPECCGSGEYVSYGPSHSASSACHKCRGEGKVVP